MKTEQLYRGMHISILAEHGQSEHSDGGAVTKNVECTLRFPFFNKDWAGGSIDIYEDDALDHFPETRTVWSMIKTDAYNRFPMSPGDVHFWDCLKRCSAREIYFLDSYFSAKNLVRLWDVLKYMDCQYDRGATDVRVYTGDKHEWACLRDEFKKLCEIGLGFEKITLRICRLDDNLLGKMHDRFVSLGKYFWHFGASAGAMHTNINAYSGPWPDKCGKCVEFMRDLREHYVVEEVSTLRTGVGR